MAFAVLSAGIRFRNRTSEGVDRLEETASVGSRQPEGGVSDDKLVETAGGATAASQPVVADKHSAIQLLSHPRPGSKRKEKKIVTIPERGRPGSKQPASDKPAGAGVHTRDPFEEANVLRKRHGIRVQGSNPPKPLKGFSELVGAYGCPDCILDNLAAERFHDPTPVQRQSIPALLKGREVIAIASTGSGKSVAFIIPLLMAARVGAAEGGTGVKALLLSPTRELSAQTGRVVQRIAKGIGLKCCLLTKPAATGTDFSQVDVLLATPLLLQRCVDKKRVGLCGVRLLVLDEADKLFDLGLMQQMDGVIAACTHTQLVRAVFSATLPEAVERLASDMMKDPLRITVGERDAALHNVKQRLMFVGQEKGKLLALRQLLSGGLKTPVLVFVATKDKAKEVHRELLYDGIHVDSIHADQPPAQRTAAVDNFRLGKTWILVTTDLLGRGMDFVGVKVVINYDFPRSRQDYIHRIGRTGRAGKDGEAITFFLEDDAPRLRAVANIIRAAGCEVPAWMLLLKKEQKHRRKRKHDVMEEEEGGGGGGVNTDAANGNSRKQHVAAQTKQSRAQAQENKSPRSQKVRERKKHQEHKQSWKRRSV